MKRICTFGLKFVLVLGISSMLSGCWDSTNLESVDYATALGIDYKDEKFEVYAQLIDFASVAKMEGKSAENAAAWVGRGVGITFYDAYNELLKTAQTEMNIEQLKTIIVREPAMAKMDELLDALNRVRVARYTSWVFGTKEDIATIFNTDNFFGMPQTVSLIYSPTEQMRRANVIEPLNMQHFVAMYNESAATVLLPSVGISTRTWELKEKPKKMQVVDGIFAIKDKGSSHYFPIEGVGAVRWVNPKFTRYLIPIVGGENVKGTVALQSVHSKIKVRLQGGKPHFTLRLRMTGEVAELSGLMTKQQIIEKVTAVIKEDTLKTYHAGRVRRDDLFNLELALYRHENTAWKRLAKNKEWLPGEDDLTVDVDFMLKGSGGFILN